MQIKPGLACSYGTFDKDFSCGPSIEISFSVRKYGTTARCFSIRYDCLFGCGKRATIGGLFRPQEHVVSFGARYLFFGEKMFSLSLAVVSSIRYRHFKTIKKVYDDLFAKSNDIRRARDFDNTSSKLNEWYNGEDLNIEECKNNINNFRIDCNKCINVYKTFKNAIHDAKMLNVANVCFERNEKRSKIAQAQHSCYYFV